MKVYPNLKLAIIGAWEQVLNTGTEVEQQNWQGKKAAIPMFEAIDVEFRAIMPRTIQLAQEQIIPNNPWADEHFKERVGGIPLNPPPSSERWPFAQANNAEFKKDEKFDHTYPERFWPKMAGDTLQYDLRRTQHKGIRFDYGDLDDVIKKLSRDPLTRQAWLPIWFPEDTGKPSNIRVPCSLGYHFMIRNGRLDIKYIMRSTDMLRHFQDDIYMAYRLAHHVKNKVAFNRIDTLGYMTFLTFSGHIFKGEEQLLDKKIKKWKSSI